MDHIELLGQLDSGDLQWRQRGDDVFLNVQNHRIAIFENSTVASVQESVLV
jgi:hypothetical protein